MTKELANEIKKIVRAECGDYTVYFNSKKGELRYTVAQWYDGTKSDVAELEKRNVLEILDSLTNHGMRPAYKRGFKRYQGFINCAYLIFT